MQIFHIVDIRHMWMCFSQLIQFNWFKRRGWTVFWLSYILWNWIWMQILKPETAHIIIAIEGFHNTECTYTHTILPRPSFPFCTVQYREKRKQQNMLLLLIYFIAGFKISTECVCKYFCHSVVVIWYCGILGRAKWRSRVWWLAKLDWYDVTWKPSIVNNSSLKNSRILQLA